MTCLAAVHVRGKGCVIGADSRFTCADYISSDSQVKIVATQDLLLACAGEAAHIQKAIATAPANIRDLVRTWDKDADVEALVYVKSQDVLISYDASGVGIVQHKIGAAGSGGSFALGYLYARPAPGTRAEAQALVRNSVRCAIKFSSSCGGRVRLVSHWCD